MLATIFQISIFVLFAIFTTYAHPVLPARVTALTEARCSYKDRRAGPALGQPSEAEVDVNSYWNYTRDVSVMIFFGFGYLMTFLRRNGYEPTGETRQT